MSEFDPPRWESPDLNEDNEQSPFPDINCNYTAPSDLQSIFDNNNNTKFSIFSINNRSCRMNFSSLKSFLVTFCLNFSLIILLETWLTEEIDFMFNLPGYNQLNLYRNGHGGGIKVLFRDYFIVNQLDRYTFLNNIIECLTFSISHGNLSYVVCSIYRPPSSNIFHLNNIIADNILNDLSTSSKVIVVGDLNINLYNPLKLNSIKEYINLLWGYSFYPLINIPAKFNENNPITKYSLIDQIWCNFGHELNWVSGVVDYLITDHLPIFCLFNSVQSVKSNYIKLRILSRENIERFIDGVVGFDFNLLYSLNNCDEAFKYFYEQLFKIYNLECPIKRKKQKTNILNQPWVTPRLKKCIQKKYKLYNLLKRGIITRNSFNKYKKMLNFVIDKMRSKYYNDKFNNISNDTKKTWSNINQLLNRKGKKSVTKLKNEFNEYMVGLDMVNHFNDYFSNIGARLSSSLPPNNDYINTTVPLTNTCVFYHTDEVEVYSLLRDMPNKGNSLYDIKPKLLNLVSYKIVPILVYLYNMCIDNGVYPSVLKEARVVPVFKTGDRELVSNYRPISNLSSFNKLFELLTFNRMYNFIAKFNILSKSQFGFMRSSSTTLAIFTLLKKYYSVVNLKGFSISLFIDLKKAFDLVDRQILYEKLQNYGFRGLSGKFLQSYLTNRSQFVSVGTFNSDVSAINFGIPQGSVLGPLLFNLFINDVGDQIMGDTILFADDTVLHVSDPSLENCITMIETVISNITRWLDNNRLIANINKTKLMLITNKPVQDLPEIVFKGVKLDWVESIKYLGLYIDNKLTFNPQIDYLCSRLSRLRGVFYSLSKYIPSKNLILLYNSLVYPILSQDIIIWGGISYNKISRIQILQNHILRSMLKVRRINNVPTVHVNEMYRVVRVIPAKKYRKTQIMKN